MNEIKESLPQQQNNNKKSNTNLSISHIPLEFSLFHSQNIAVKSLNINTSLYHEQTRNIMHTLV